MITQPPGAEPGTASAVSTTPPEIRPLRWRWSRLPLGDLLALLGIASIFVGGMTYLGALRVENFFTGNWDLGINQQLLWTTAHGRLLYETGDVGFYGVQSFLQVHPTYVAFLVVPVYSVAPNPSTLFAVQALIFIASTVPIYFLARQLISDRGTTFLIVLLYVTSFPVISALLYDYHWEAFIPLEFLCFFYLFRSRRYVWSLIPLAFGILTLEVFPFLVVGVALLVFFEEYQRLGPHIRSWSASREVRIAIALVVAMVVAYVALRFVQYVAVPAVLGTSTGIGQVSSAISSPFSITVTWKSLGLSANYWLLMAAAVAFLPFFAPRYLLLTLPWFVYTVFLSPFYASQYGNQYALVAMATLSVAMVYGSARLIQIVPRDRARAVLIAIPLASGVALLTGSIGWSRSILSRSVPWPLEVLLAALPLAVVASIVYAWRRDHRPGTGVTAPKASRWTRPRTRSTVVAATVVAFVAFNLAMSPMNTANFRATAYPGYALKYSPNPASDRMNWITDRIPADAVVLSSDFLFSYVANNPNAWAVPWYPPSSDQPPYHLPFSATDLPRYVLIDTADWYNFPTYVTSSLSNSTTYGLVAFVYSQEYPGTISLYELGFSGTPQAWYETIPRETQYLPPANLTVGPSGRIGTDSSSMFGDVIESEPVAHPSPAEHVVWTGPNGSLPPGTYEMTANLSGGVFGTGNPADPIVFLIGGPVGSSPLYNLSIDASQMSPTGWTSIHWTIDLPVSDSELEFEGVLDYFGGEPNGWVTLNYLEVSG